MKSYKFFHGFDRQRRVTWIIDEEGYRDENLMENLLVEEIQRVIDDDIISQLTRRVNGGGQDNIQYLNHYINMGGGNRA
jgi:hypothetical protein